MNLPKNIVEYIKKEGIFKVIDQLETYKKDKVIRVMLAGDSITATSGTGQILAEWGAELVKHGFEVYAVAFKMQDIELTTTTGIKMLPAYYDIKSKKSINEFGSTIAKYIRKYNPHFFITFGDCHHLTNLAIGNINLSNSNCKFIHYETHDCEGMLNNWAITNSGRKEVLLRTDKTITTTYYGKHELEKEFFKVDNVIPLFVDHTLFTPVSKSVKKIIREKYGIPKDAFVVFTCGRVQYRKRQEILIEGMCKLMCKHEDIYLVAYCPGYNETNSMNLEEFIGRNMYRDYNRNFLNEGKIIFVTGKGVSLGRGMAKSIMVEFYIMSDLFLSTSAGEGFGLCQVESQLCGVPVLTPDNTSGKEIVGDKRMLLDTLPGINVGYGIKQKFTTPEEVEKKVEELYESPNLRDELGKIGRKYCMKKFNKSIFINSWLKELKTKKVTNNGEI